MQLTPSLHHQDIGFLDVPVEDVPLVELLDCGHELSEDQLYDVFGHGRVPPLTRNVLAEVTHGKIFGDNVEIIIILEIVQKDEHVRDLTTAYLLHDLDLSVGLHRITKDILGEGIVDGFYDDL